MRFDTFKQFATYSPKRFENHKSLEENDVKYFKSFLAENEITQDSTELQRYNLDWTLKYKGESKIVLKPKTTENIQKILKYCNENGLPICPQGGNTGLVGGGVPIFDEIILSLQNLNKIQKFDQQTNILTCEAGCVLENINEFLKQYNSELPWDLGAKGSCQIGGNISTHAAGKYLIKHGPLRANITGLEAVLANGEILNLQSELRKDNTGFDIKQLFIGAEGLLGIITKCNVLVTKIDAFKKLIFLKVDNFNQILNIYEIAKQTLSKNLAAFEFMDSNSFNIVNSQMKNIVNPFSNSSIDHTSYYALVEVQSNIDPEKLIEQFYGEVEQNKCSLDSVLSENESQYDNLWKLREYVGTAFAETGTVLKYDITLHPNQQLKLIQLVRENLGTKYNGGAYGHIGDGNMHLNISVKNKEEIQNLSNQLDKLVFEYIRDVKGSISAEHGVGVNKIDYLPYSKSEEAIKYMKQLKQVFDPNFILNPYKMLKFY